MPALRRDNITSRVLFRYVWHYAAEACIFPTLLVMLMSMVEDYGNDNVNCDDDDEYGFEEGKEQSLGVR